MESLLTRYRNVSILMAVLFAQVLGLAIQVRRAPTGESNRLIRVWAVAAVTPLEKAITRMQSATGSLWSNYIYLRGVRQQNRDLKYQIENLRLQQVRLSEDANQARRLQALLNFKEQYVAKTVAAQVIGSTGSEHSRAVYIDKGSDDGIKNEMPVITADGVVGKIWQVYDAHTSLVLLINDQSSGVGAILANSRLQGILRGTPSGEVVLEKVLGDEQVLPGETVLTSGGDQIFPKGLPAGVVTSVSRGPDAFLNIRIRPAADLSKLEEVLVITKKEHAATEVTTAQPTRAADILAQRLPSVPDNAAEVTEGPGDEKPAPAPGEANATAKAQAAATQAAGAKAGALPAGGPAGNGSAAAKASQNSSANGVKRISDKPVTSTVKPEHSPPDSTPVEAKPQ